MMKDSVTDFMGQDNPLDWLRQVAVDGDVLFPSYDDFNAFVFSHTNTRKCMEKMKLEELRADAQ